MTCRTDYGVKSTKIHKIQVFYIGWNERHTHMRFNFLTLCQSNAALSWHDIVYLQKTNVTIWPTNFYGQGLALRIMCTVYTSALLWLCSLNQVQDCPEKVLPKEEDCHDFPRHIRCNVSGEPMASYRWTNWVWENRLKFKTSGKTPIIWDESMEYTKSTQ